MTDIVLLDGGMGQELIHRAGDKPTPRWSTQVMIDRPGLVAEVHDDYAKAGATVGTTNTYAIHRDRLMGGSRNHYAGTDAELPDIEDQFGDLLTMALDEADVLKGKSRIAGAIGPLGGSYRADLHPEHGVAVERFSEVVAHLAPRVDIILFETIASVAAARSCLEAGRSSNLPVWLSFTVDDEDGSRLRSGEAVSEAAAIAAEADAAIANCSAPEAMPDALDALAASGVPTGAYANAFQMITKAFISGGTTAEDLSARRDLGPAIYAEHAMRWIDHGATIIGGCCETGPAHIAAIRDAVTKAGHRIV